MHARAKICFAMLSQRVLIALAAALATLQGASASTCDLFSAGGTPCVAAHSTVRALYASFAGPLYQVRLSDSGGGSVGGNVARS